MIVARRFTFYMAAIAACLILAASPSALCKKKAATKVERQERLIPIEVINSIADGDLKHAAIILNDFEATPKSSYLMHEISRIFAFEFAERPSIAEAHNVYQNVAIAYHNLYLFLKANGIEDWNYYDRAMDYYKKARRSGTYLHKADCDMLMATLMANAGETKKAEKKFSKINDIMMRGDFESMEYLAAYYAALGEVTPAMEYLKLAYKLNRDQLMMWLVVGDDFYGIKDDPSFSALMKSWKLEKKERQISLAMPKAKKPSLKVDDPTGLFDIHNKIKYKKKKKQK